MVYTKIWIEKDIEKSEYSMKDIYTTHSIFEAVIFSGNKLCYSFIMEVLSLSQVPLGRVNW